LLFIDAGKNIIVLKPPFLFVVRVKPYLHIGIEWVDCL
jgi:hypothetical protein